MYVECAAVKAGLHGFPDDVELFALDHQDLRSLALHSGDLEQSTQVFPCPHHEVHFPAGFGGHAGMNHTSHDSEHSGRLPKVPGVLPNCRPQHSWVQLMQVVCRRLCHIDQFAPPDAEGRAS